MELRALSLGMLLPETSDSSSLRRNLPIDNCRHWVSLIGKGQELCFPSAHKHYFRNILGSHLLCLSFDTGDLCPVPAVVVRLAGRTAPGMILMHPQPETVTAPFLQLDEWRENEFTGQFFLSWGRM